MTAYTTAATGNWSATGTWTGGVVPGNGDTVTLNHNVTVDVDTIIGTSPAENSGTYAITWGAATKKLTIASGVTLRVRGDCLGQGNTTKNDLVLMQSGSTWIFDASQASSPTSQNYRFIFATAGGQYGVFRVQGTSGARCAVMSDSGGGNGFFTRNSLTICGYINAAYCDFTRIGDATNPVIDGYLGNTSNAEITFDNCRFIDGGQVSGGGTAAATGAKFSITNCSWSGTLPSQCLVLPTFTNTGTKVVSGSVFDKEVSIGQGAWTLSDARGNGNLFQGGYTAVAGTKWATSIGNFVRRTTQPSLNVYGDLTDEWWYKDGTIANSQMMTLGVTSGLTIDGVIIATSDSNAVGDMIGVSSPGGARTHTIKNCILLPDETSGNQPGKLHGSGGNANNTILCYHNTYISTAAGETALSYGETYNGHDGILTAKSNLAWSDTSGEASIAIRQAGSVQQSNATKWDYNAGWNLRSGTDGSGYNSISAGTIFSSGSPGAHDFAVSSDPFVDRTRNLPTWDAALGGPGTAANAIAELAKRNDPTGYNTAYSIEALVDWVRGGFDVTDSSLEDAGHDGVTIGAGAYVASGVSGTATVGLALAAAAVGTVLVQVTATLALALGVAATGTVPRTGTATVPLVLTAAAAGTVGSVPIAGTASITLPLDISATGTVPRTGTASVALALDVAATGTVPRTGAATVALALGLTADGAVGSVPIAGTAAVPLALGIVATGTVPRTGTASVALPLDLTASGTVPRTGTAAVLLPLDLAATGTVVTGAPYAGQIRLTSARGPALAFTAGNGPALRFTPREPST